MSVPILHSAMKLLISILLLVVLTEARWAPATKNAEDVRPEAENNVAKSYFRLPVRSSRFDDADFDVEFLKRHLLKDPLVMAYNQAYRG